MAVDHINIREAREARAPVRSCGLGHNAYWTMSPSRAFQVALRASEAGGMLLCGVASFFDIDGVVVGRFRPRGATAVRFKD